MRGALCAFHTEPAALHLWLRIEGEDSRAMLERATSDEGNWRTGKGAAIEGAGRRSGAWALLGDDDDDFGGRQPFGASGAGAAASLSADGVRAVPPACAVVVMRHGQNLLGRLRLVDEREVQRGFINKVRKTRIRPGGRGPMALGGRSAAAGVAAAAADVPCPSPSPPLPLSPSPRCSCLCSSSSAARCAHASR